jgi:hypothetical protein
MFAYAIQKGLFMMQNLLLPYEEVIMAVTKIDIEYGVVRYI